MTKQRLRSCLLTGCLCSIGLMANAQEIVHALTGTVAAIDPKAHTIQVKTYDDSEGLFKTVLKPGVSIDFDSKVKARSIPAATFNKQNANVLVYYIGDDAERTVVAIQDLGAGPLGKSKGTVVQFNKHQHQLVVKTDEGPEQTLTIDPKAIAETAEGVILGEKFDPGKGDHLWITFRAAGGTNTALFLRTR